MIYTEDNLPEKPLIVIEEGSDASADQPAGEAPVIIIENDEPSVGNQPSESGSRRRWPWMLATAAATALFCLLVWGGIRLYRAYAAIGVPVSVTSEENIAKLQRQPAQERPEVIIGSDSILGVGFNVYELRGLRAYITFDQPDTSDTSVYLYSRCSDFSSYNPDENHYLGSLVVEGKELSHDVSRLGYCAMADGNVVIGIARDEKVKRHCIERGGSFFRQFILVSDGVLPPRFQLHGKVERRAFGRMGDQLYYIESHGKESLWSFADALREYGFTDAIYITGGTDYCFCRNAAGVRHDIGNTANAGKKHKGEGLIPWVVFTPR